MVRQVLRLFVVAAAFFITACESDYPATGAPERATSPAATPRQVQVARATSEAVARGTVVTGTLAAEEQVVLSLKVAGRLREISVDLGSNVHEGQVIAHLDPTDFHLRIQQVEAILQQARARLGLAPQGTDDRVDPEHAPVVRQARAGLDEAQRNYARTGTLWERQLIARAELDTAAMTLQVAEGRHQDAIEEVRIRQAVLAERRSELEIARQQLLDSVLKAPIAGAVRQRHAAAGEYLAAGTPIVTLMRIHPLRLRLSVPERMVANVRLGQPVHVKVEGIPGAVQGKVARLSPAFDEQDRTLLIEAEVPNAQGQLRPGASAEAEIVTAAEEQVILVPVSAIVTFAGIEKVLTVMDGKSVEKRVKTGRRFGARVEIMSGLAPDEMVVMEPGNLVGGLPVTLKQ